MDPPPPRRRSPRNLSSTNSGSFSTQGKAAANKNDSSSSNAATETKIKIKIKRYHGVAKWTWGVSGFNNDDDDDEDEVCIICQTAFEGCAPGVKYPGDESPVVFGKWLDLLFIVYFRLIISILLLLTSNDALMLSKHAFHLQCVSTWLQSQNSNNPTCPTCRQEWEFGAERTVDEDGGESVEV